MFGDVDDVDLDFGGVGVKSKCDCMKNIIFK